jgi:hypothetical protein
MADTEAPAGMTDEDRAAITAALVAAQAPPSELYKALAQANLVFPPVIGEGLDYIMSAVRKPLAENGLALVQRIVAKDPTGEFVETTLVHASGESICNLTKMIADVEDQVGYSRAQSVAAYAGVRLLLCLSATEQIGNGKTGGARAAKP